METNLTTNTNENSGIDPKLLLALVVSKWYWFVLSLIITFLLSHYYIKYSQSIYSVKSSLLIKDDKKNLSAENLLDFSLGSSRNVENEIEILRSYKIVEKAIRYLNWNVSYFVKGDIKEGELYKSSPFTIYCDTQFVQTIGKAFYIEYLTDSTYKIYTQNENKGLNLFRKVVSNRTFEITGKFGHTLRTEGFAITVLNNSNGHWPTNVEYYFILNNIKSLARVYASNLDIQINGKKSTILNLSLSGPVPLKEAEFLDALSQTYIQNDLDEKNQIFTNTINFIDGLLIDIADSLKGAENQLENFKKRERLTEISDVSSRAYTQLEKLEDERAQLIVKDKYYHYLLQYLISNQDIKQLAAPSAIGIGDELLVKLIDELYSIHSEQNALGFSAKEKNPTYQVLELKFQNIKKAIIENVKNIIQGSAIALKDIEERIKQVQGLLNQLPSKEINLVKINRKFNLNDNIYNFLLEKRTDASIAKAAATADNKVINEAIITGTISPNLTKIRIFTLLTALLIPLGLIYFQLVIKNTVLNKETIERRTSIPIIGSIGHNKSGTVAMPVIVNPKSIISESFRSLRINLQYLSSEKKNKIIGITSSVSGEGKTFFSLNLAASIALSGAKVIIIGADLRKPKLHVNLGVANEKGLSTYLIHKSSLEDIIMSTQLPNLDVIPAGPIPPNPTELMEKSLMKELLENLSLKYEYIIIDAPPVGLVADYYLLSKYSDANLFIIRQNYTKESALNELNQIHNSKKLSNMFLVFNDIKVNNNYGYGGYGYGYGNGYGYYEEKKLSPKERIKNFFSGLFKI